MIDFCGRSRDVISKKIDSFCVLMLLFFDGNAIAAGNVSSSASDDFYRGVSFAQGMFDKAAAFGRIRWR